LDGTAFDSPGAEQEHIHSATVVIVDLVGLEGEKALGNIDF
jgi:hypothetical protein